MTTDLAGASPVDQPVMPLAPERAAFVAWMRDFANVADNYWMRDPKMGEHDAALSAWLYQQREIERLRAALLHCARQAEALKRECGPDPEGAQAVRNGKYQAISTAAHIALGTTCANCAGRATTTQPNNCGLRRGGHEVDKSTRPGTGIHSTCRRRAR